MFSLPFFVAADALTVILPIVATVIGGLVAGGAVAFYLAKPNKDKIAAETAAIEQTARNAAVDSVTKALDRQDKTIEQLETKAKADAKIIDAFTSTVRNLDDRVAFLEEALTAAGAAAHVVASAVDADAAIAEGRVVVVQREMRDNGEDKE